MRKDAGDDPDVTHAMLVTASVSWLDGDAVLLVAGDGVGTVTKHGLSVLPGEPAINPVPRRMIRSEVRRLTERGVRVVLIGVGTTHWIASPLPPNRASGSPAPGSPVDGSPSQGLKICAMGFLKAEQPTHVKETIGPFDMIETTTYAAPFPFAPFPQYAAKTLPNPPVNRPVGSFAGMFEVFKPTLKGFVYIRNDLFKTVTVAPLGLVADCIPEFPDTLLPGITRAPIESVSEKIKSPASFREINDLGLVRMQLQPFVFDQLAHQGECAPCFIQGLAQDHEVVRIPDHPITRLGHCKINRVQIQVGKQRVYKPPAASPLPESSALLHRGCPP